MPAASGFARAARPYPELAAEAVSRALARAGIERADQLLLFLSADFAVNPGPALRAAAAAGQTLSISGCTAVGVMNEDEASLDGPAAVALVLDGTSLLSKPSQAAPCALTFAAPNAINRAWLRDGPPRLGGVAGDATGRGPYKVWHQARVVAEGRTTLPLMHAPEVLIDHGVEPLAPPMTVTGIDGFVLHTLDHRLAATTLRRALSPLPALHTLSLATLDPDGKIIQCWPVVALHDDGTATVSARLFPGQRVCWMVQRAAPALPQSSQRWPSFALVFGCGARAMSGGEDADWRAVHERWPGLPFAGFQGNGQFAAPRGETLLLQRSLVVSLHH